MSIKACLEIELEDRPGHLRRLLEIFEQVNANIISTVHSRVRSSSILVPVEIIFTIPRKEMLENMNALLKQGGWHILSLSKIIEMKRINLGIVGHIITN